MPSESISIPLETPTKLLDDYETEPRGRIVTEASIEHRASIRSQSDHDDCCSNKRDSYISKSSSRDSHMSGASSSARDSRVVTAARQESRPDSGETKVSFAEFSMRNYVYIF